jgi:hypothetical protein
VLSRLLQLVENDTQSIDRTNPLLAPFWPIRESIFIQDDVLMYNDRVVIPLSLRKRVLEHLHAAHQGTSTMEQRARFIAYWPGMSKDIKQTRESCTDCNRNAPSQPATSPLSSPPPTTPFESVFADFFDYSGHHYLVVGDRLSGWVEVFGSKAGTKTTQGQQVLYATSALCSPRSAYLRNYPAMVDRNLLRAVQKISYAHGS